jgi:WD40 repeat protein
MLFSMLLLVMSTTAQESDFTGFALVSLFEPGGTERLYRANLLDGSFSELQIERSGFTPRWFGWSPDGRYYAYLAPTRQNGLNYELWLVNANGSNPRTPFLDEGDQKAVAAAWHPTLNILAVATVSENNIRDGLFLVNANTGDVVYTLAEDISPNTLLDWSQGGQQVAFTTIDNELSMVNTTSGDAFALTILDGSPMLLPQFRSGWTAGDSGYVWIDERGLSPRYSSLQTRNTITILEEVPPFDIIPAGDSLIFYQNNAFKRFDNLTGEIDVLLETNLLVDDFGLLADGALLFNALLPDGSSRCHRLTMDGNLQSIEGWRHTRCRVLGSFFALLTSDEPEAWDTLTNYSLSMVPQSGVQIYPITDNYAGFEAAPIYFSASWLQLMFEEDNALVVYNLEGEKQVLVAYDDLGITSTPVIYTVRWQP